jgi:hypothetical protein
MAGNILQAARKDSKKYVNEGGFESDIILTNPTSNISIETTGWAAKHHINFDTDGAPINAKNAHICVDEEKLEAGGYSVRVNEEVQLIGHKVEVKDNSGILKKYIIKENFPNETLGLIVCVLGDLEEN